jgi:pimeloyl-ACP methyl ester carboxylesterase
MDHVASRGYDVYALDLRGMGSSDHPADYSAIDILSRVQDAMAVARHIVANTGVAPVVVGWSQGGGDHGTSSCVSLATRSRCGILVSARQWLFRAAAIRPLLQSVVASRTDRYLPAPDLLYAIVFGFDPVTGQPTIGPDAFATFVAMSEPDSVRALLEALSSDFFSTAVVPAWSRIQVPALVMDGAQDATCWRGSPHSPLHHSVSDPRDLEPDRRISRTRLAGVKTGPRVLESEVRETLSLPLLQLFRPAPTLRQRVWETRSSPPNSVWE